MNRLADWWKAHWTSWKAHQTWVVVRVLAIVVAFVGLALWFQGAHCPACEPPYEANDRYYCDKGWKGWICRTINDPEAVFAVALVFCNALFFGYLSRQVRQTEETNTQTKRSVDVLIEIERGRIELDAMDMTPPTPTALAELRMMFINAGRTGATSIERGTNIQLIGPTDVILDAPFARAFTVTQERMPVPTGQQYGYGAPRDLRDMFLSANASAQWPEIVSGRIRMFVQGYIRYEIVAGQRACNWFTYLYMPAINRFVPDAGCAFNGHCLETTTDRPVFQ